MPARPIAKSTPSSVLSLHNPIMCWKHLIAAGGIYVGMIRKCSNGELRFQSFHPLCTPAGIAVPRGTLISLRPSSFHLEADEADDMEPLSRKTEKNLTTSQVPWDWWKHLASTFSVI